MIISGNILIQIKKNDVAAFRQLFDTIYFKLVEYSFKYVRKKEVAEEIAQDMLIYLWEHRIDIKIESSLENYLLAGVKNRSLNYLKSKYGSKEFDELLELHGQSFEMPVDNVLELKELEDLIKLAVKKLPPKCNTIFHLSRNADMTYQEIADELDISKETVKTQIGVALQKIREFLGKHWDTLPGG